MAPRPLTPNELRLTMRAERFARLLSLNAPWIIIEGEFDLIAQAMDLYRRDNNYTVEQAKALRAEGLARAKLEQNEKEQT